ncbi:E3 ubiquitin-protein ligase TRIM71-like [Stylophora pistillata]|uniref:E3 ubiquitin-protein ligase TRIM71-like n=1 Tax=Stylophora pistillata TaxID=50429 RepID=UPI000C050F5F|nr:E3 ubiquitin-protein ligase TRIM71-like [Stylophora pistillata]
MESFLKNLQEQVTCSICLDTYKKPKIISCLHTFCCNCLKKHALTSQRNGKYRCPECQAPIDLPKDNSFDSLPTSFFHNSLLSVLAVRQIGDGRSITCSQCRKNNSRMHYCFDCGLFMCPDILNAHEVLKTSFEGHKVISVKEFKAEDYELLLRRQPFCSQQFHEKEIMRFFCVPCQSCICHICIVTDHRNHEVVVLDKAAQDEKHNIITGTESIKEKIKELNADIRQLEETTSVMESNVSKAKREVMEAAEQMITKIRACEREVITSIETTRAKRLERIDSAKQDILSLLKQLNQAVDFADNIVKRSSSTDIMQNKGTLKERFEELSAIYHEVPKHGDIVYVKFTPASLANLTFGSVQKTKKADVKESTLQGIDQPLRASVEADFSLCPKTSSGEICDMKSKQIEFLVEPADAASKTSVNENEEGTFQLKFTPKVPGEYSLEVKINGEKLAICPITVLVKECELAVVGELDLNFFPGDKLQGPFGIALNKEGTIVVVDYSGYSVYVFDSERTCLRKLGPFKHPFDVAFVDDEEILVSDYGNHRIYQYNTRTGEYIKRLGRPGTGKGEFTNPIGLFMDDKEQIVICDYGNNRIQVLTKDGVNIFTFGDTGPEKLSRPLSCISHKGRFFVSDNCCIKVFDQTGQFLYKFGSKGMVNGQFGRPSGLHIDRQDCLLVCDQNSGRFQKFSLDGRFIGKCTTPGLTNLNGVAEMPDGRILVTSTNAAKVHIITTK